MSSFNFRGTDQQKMVGALSGGESNRVHLAKLLQSGGNVLLIDEPTNDQPPSPARLKQAAASRDFSTSEQMASGDPAAVLPDVRPAANMMLDCAGGNGQMTVLKTVDNKQPQLAALQTLLDRKDIDDHTRKRIQDQIWMLRAGMEGEREAAYEIDFHYGRGENHAVIHDLRIELNDRVAQIDHLIINRGFDLWICETKSFAQGVKINDQGEWLRYGPKFATGIPSPIEQNRRHLMVLDDLLTGGAIQLPRRLVTLRPTLRPVVLVSNGARIDRPKSKQARDAIEGLETVIKVDQLVTTINRSIDRRNPVGLLAKVVGSNTVLGLGRQLVALHKPATFDWAAMFGLAPLAAVANAGPPVSAAPVSPTGGGTCASCGRAVSAKVASFSLEHAAQFGGKVLCFDCQQTARQALRRAAAR